jgi:transposase InsO family protein
MPESTCSCHTARRFLESLPQATIDLYRNGRESFANSHLPFVDRTITAFKSLDCVVSDHHCLDMACLYNGKLVRPWITTFQDYRSGKVLGWCLALNPSSLSIVCAYYMAAIAYGIPRALLFDNGRDYRSKLLNGYSETFWTTTIDGLYKEVESHVRGLFEIIGSEVHFTETYNGKSKGRQERYYRMLQEYIAKPSGGFIGSDTADRPESSELFFRNVQGRLKNNDLPSWEDVKGMANAMIPFINDNFHSQGKGMDGKTASQVFDENLPGGVRRADRDVLEFALTRGRVMGVRKSQVWIQGVGYYNEKLLSYSGRKVIVRQSLLSDAEVLICDMDDRYLFTAAANEFKEAPGDPRKAIEAARRERRRRSPPPRRSARGRRGRTPPTRRG